MENADSFLIAQSRFVSSEVGQLLEDKAFLLPNWKWLIIVVAVVGGFLLRPLIQYILKKLKSAAPDRLRARQNFFYHLLEQKIEQPLAWIILGSIWKFANDAVDLPPNADKYISHALTALFGYFLIKLVYLAVDAFGKVLNDIVSKTESTVDDQLAPLATKTLKVLVVVLGALMIFQGFGLNVMSLLAGLGLGGLALALAAQDTAANVFGSITILMDQPFKIGDWIKILDVEGTVEEIGFRSTRVRTFYNSLITIPNATIAKEKIDNLGERPVRRIRHSLGIHYDTPVPLIESFCESVRQLIIKNKSVVQDTASVIFNGYGDSALNILVNFHIQVKDTNEEVALQQKILLEILTLSKTLKVDFAYPTRTLYIPNMGPALIPPGSASSEAATANRN